MFEAGLYQLLSADPDLVALQAARVYPVLLQEGSALPASTYQTVGGGSTPGLRNSGPQRRKVQIDHFGQSAEDAWKVRDATREVLDGFQGALPNGFVLTGCIFLQPVDYFDSDARQFRCASEYYFFFNLQ